MSNGLINIQASASLLLAVRGQVRDLPDEAYIRRLITPGEAEWQIGHQSLQWGQGTSEGNIDTVMQWSFDLTAANQSDDIDLRDIASDVSGDPIEFDKVVAIMLHPLAYTGTPPAGMNVAELRVAGVTNGWAGTDSPFPQIGGSTGAQVACKYNGVIGLHSGDKAWTVSPTTAILRVGLHNDFISVIGAETLTVALLIVGRRA